MAARLTDAELRAKLFAPVGDGTRRRTDDMAVCARELLRCRRALRELAKNAAFESERYLARKALGSTRKGGK